MHKLSIRKLNYSPESFVKLESFNRYFVNIIIESSNITQIFSYYIIIPSLIHVIITINEEYQY